MTGKKPGATLANLVRHTLSAQIRVPKMKWGTLGAGKPTAFKGIYAPSSSLTRLIPQFNAELVK